MTASRFGSIREKILSYMTVDDIQLLEYGINELESIQQLDDSALAQIIVLDRLDKKELEKKILDNLKGSLGGK